MVRRLPLDLSAPNEESHPLSFVVTTVSKLQDPPTTPGKVETLNTPSRGTRATQPAVAAVPFSLPPASTPKPEPATSQLSSSVEKASSRASIETGSSSLTANNATLSSQEPKRQSPAKSNPRENVEPTEIEEPSDPTPVGASVDVNGSKSTDVVPEQQKKPSKSTPAPPRSKTRSAPVTPALKGSKSKTAAKAEVEEQSEDSSNIQIEEERNVRGGAPEQSDSDDEDESEAPSTFDDGTPRAVELKGLVGTGSRFYKMWEPSGDRKSRHRRNSSSDMKKTPIAKPKPKPKPKPKAQPKPKEETETEKAPEAEVKAKRPTVWAIQGKMRQPGMSTPHVSTHSPRTPVRDADAQREWKRKLNREIRKMSMVLEESNRKRLKTQEIDS
jgi:hypothetical protein